MSLLTVALNDEIIWTVGEPAAGEIGQLAFAPFPTTTTNALIMAEELIAAAAQATPSDYLNAIIDLLLEKEDITMVRLEWDRG